MHQYQFLIIKIFFFKFLKSYHTITYLRSWYRLFMYVLNSISIFYFLKMFSSIFIVTNSALAFSILIQSYLSLDFFKCLFKILRFFLGFFNLTCNCTASFSTPFKSGVSNIWPVGWIQHMDPLHLAHRGISWPLEVVGVWPGPVAGLRIWGSQAPVGIDWWQEHK